MKKILLFICCLFLLTATQAQYVNIPDSNFRKFLILKYPSCFNGAGQMDTACPSIVNELSITCIGYSIVNLEGIQYFKSLKYFDCYNNNITSLQVLPDSLLMLWCRNNLLASLPTLPSSLQSLICNHNQLTSLPTLPSSLQYLECSQNHLTSLPTLPSSLEGLTCYENLLTSLPTLPSSLQSLVCIQNQIVNLPTLPNSLQYLACSQNQLVNLPTLPNSLHELACNQNQLVNLPALPDSLLHLSCVNNKLTSLPNLPSVLTDLNCGTNKLTSLPTLPNLLENLYCSDNNQLSCLPKLPNSLHQLYIINTHISCIPNTTALNAYINPQLPLCNATNNPNGCVSFPIIHGNVYGDMDTNNIWDSVELGRERVKISLANGASTFTQKNGFYEISADSIGVNTVSIHQPNLYKAQPISFTHNFSKYDTLVTDTFALQATIIKDSLSTVAKPINWAARPGFSFPYLISSENVGTITTNPTVHFIWDSSKLVLDSTTNIAAINVGNDLSWNISNFVPGQMDNVVAYFRVKATTAIGDSINYIANISDGIASATDSGRTIVRGSYDPNEKQATPVLTPAQCALGKYIDYTIYFQNTGTDTAFTVVIADTLSSNLIDSSLQIINSSHTCKTTQNGNKVFFEFKNILLPDSNINEKKSHGFVSFKVKPKPTLLNGNTVENKASIYFDYNTPIVTNTAITQINTSGVVLPVQMNSYDVRKVSENKVLNYWTTVTEIDALLFNVQRSEDARTFKTFGKVLAKGNSSNYEFTDVLNTNSISSTLYYRLQIIDKNGSITYSAIKQIRLNELNNLSIALYPNPTKDFVHIESKDGIKKIKIFNSIGQQVVSYLYNNSIKSQTLNLKQLKKGIYIVQVTTVKGELLDEKLIVE